MTIDEQIEYMERKYEYYYGNNYNGNTESRELEPIKAILNTLKEVKQSQKSQEVRE